MFGDALWIQMSANECKDTFSVVVLFFSADFFTTLKKNTKNLQAGEGRVGSGRFVGFID